MKEGDILTFKEVEKILIKDDWYRYKVVGSHYQYKHKEKEGKITIPRHNKEIKKRNIKFNIKTSKFKRRDLN